MSDAPCPKCTQTIPLKDDRFTDHKSLNGLNCPGSGLGVPPDPNILDPRIEHVVRLALESDAISINANCARALLAEIDRLREWRGEIVLAKTPPEPPADWIAEKLTDADRDGFCGMLPSKLFQMLRQGIEAGWRKGWRAAIEHTIEQIRGDSAGS
jgi:hypothetical protein